MDLDNFTIVDLETTGLSPQADRIIEVALLKVEKGRVADQFSTLVNPGRSIPPFIEQLTGIRAGDLIGAPTFEKIAFKLSVYFSHGVLVAHNARFDHGFLKNEFKRLGLSFTAKSLCTVRLSRKLYPRYRSHGLDRVISRLGIQVEERHRAMGDAKAVWNFLEHIQKEFSAEQINDAVAQILKSPSLPPMVSAKRMESLPRGPGVYIFYNEKKSPLYVGKSIHIRERVRSHFSSDHTRGSELNLCRQTKDIEAISTAGELGALLLESYLIKKLNPWFNRRSRESRRLVVARRKMNSSGYYEVKLERVERLHPWDLSGILGIYRSFAQAKNIMVEKREEFELCSRLLGLERSRGRCFSRQLRKCQGACEGKEPSFSYNHRLAEAFDPTTIPDWPYPGPIQIEEKNSKGKRVDRFWVDRWCLIGGWSEDSQSWGMHPAAGYVFDWDSYKILKNHLAKHPKKIRIRVRRPAREHLSGQSPLPGLGIEALREGQQLSLGIFES